MAARPTGTVTFLFTDIEGSTAAWERNDTAMARSMEIHDGVVRSAIREHDGVVFATGGDGVAAAFARADDALRAAIDAQHRLGIADWADGPALVIRMGLHTGEAHERDGDYLGGAVNRAARVAGVANGGQILCTRTTAEVLGGEFSGFVELGAHILRDVVEPVELLRVDHPSCPDTRPPRGGAMHVGNVPAEVEPVVGRDAAVQAVLDDLASHRLVTLTGVGGMGKTTLALAAARRARPTMPDGTWLARLDEIDDEEDVVDLLVGLFGASGGADDGLNSLAAALAPRRALLVIDNCEHVLKMAATVVERLLQSSPRLTILATSRVPLGVAGERLFRVPALTLGADGTAAELFATRSAERATPVDEDAADVVAAICRRLDGIPLAIELAAARTITFSEREILDELDHMLPLLSRGRESGPARHRTLAAAIEWSIESLDPSTRPVCSDLSVFVGGFDMDAARSVCGEDDVVEALERLVEASLVDISSEGSGRRFRMLEPVRQCVEPGRAATARRRHADHYAQLIRDLDRRWRNGDDQGTWPIARRELRNIHAAFGWMCEQGRVDDAQAIAVAGFGPIMCHFDYLPQDDWAPRSLALDADHVGPWTASACGVATWGALARADRDRALGYIRRGRAAADHGSTDDDLLVAAALHAARYGHPLALDDDHLDGATRRARDSDDLFTRALLCSCLFDPNGSAVRADPTLVEVSADAARRLGNHVVSGLAVAAQMRRPPEDPRSVLEDSWENAQRAHSFIIQNSTAHVFGAYEVHAGTTADGLLMLRGPARDWLYRGDIRAAAVLRSMAAGFARAGDRETASTLLGAIGPTSGNHIGTLHRADTRALEAITPAPPGELDLAGAVDLACERAEALASRPPTSSENEMGLTERQLEVAQLVARGLGNKEIARRLDISRYTVETHVRNILERIDGTSRTQVATWLLSRAT